MKTDDLITKLQELDYPEIQPAVHKRRLKAALISLISAKASKTAGLSLSDYFKGASMLKKVVIPACSMVVAALVIVLGVTLTSHPVSVQAKDIAEGAVKVVNALPPDQLQALEASMPNIENMLQDALNAGDLTKIAPSAVQSELGAVQAAGTSTTGGGFVVNGTPCATAPVLPPIATQAVNYLRYVDSNGQVVTIGLDSNDVPVVVLTTTSIIPSSVSATIIPVPVTTNATTPVTVISVPTIIITVPSGLTVPAPAVTVYNGN